MKKNYSIQVYKLVAAILVVAIHAIPFYDINVNLGFIVHDIIDRTAVPFFFMVSGYFYAEKIVERKNYVNHYLKNVLKIYLFWSIVFLPLDFFKIYNLTYDIFYTIELYIWRLFFVGSHFHLWFFPALIFSMLILDFWYKRLKSNIKYTILIIFLLYFIGLLDLSYSCSNIFANNDIFNHLKDIYEGVFATTRNGLFFGIPFVFLGYYLGKKKNIYIMYSYKYIFLFISGSILLSIFEIYISKYFFGIKGAEGDIFIVLPLLSFWIFVCLIKDPFSKKRMKLIDMDLSLGIYIIHPIILNLINESLLKLNIYISNTIKFIIIIVLSIIITIIIKELQIRYFSRLKGVI